MKAAHRTVIRIAVGLLSGQLLLLAQTQAPSPPPVPNPPTESGSPASSTSPDSSTPSAPEITSIEAAIAVLDALQGQPDPDILRPKVESLNKYIASLKAAEPGNPWLYYLSGRTLAVLRRRGDAMEQLRLFVETREGRNEWTAHRILGDLSVDEFPNLARASYEKALRLKPGEPSVLYGLSLCASKMAHIDDAIRFARAAVEAQQDPKDPRYLAQLAKAYMAKRDWSSAEAAAIDAVKVADSVARNDPLRRLPLETLDAQVNLLIEVLRQRAGDASADPKELMRLADLIEKRGDIALRLAMIDKLALLERTAAKSTAPLPEFTHHIEQLKKDLYAHAQRPILD